MRVPGFVAVSIVGLWACGLAAGCGHRDSDDTGTQDDEGGDTGGEDLLDAPTPMPVVCPDQDLGAVDSVSVDGDTTGAPALRSGTCGGRGAPERVYAWTAPEAGVYEVWVEAEFDAVLSVLFGNCDGAMLLCSDDNTGKDFQPRVFVDAAEAGAEYALVVDGHGDGGKLAYGAYTLHIAPFAYGACPTLDFGSTFPATHTFDSGVSLVDTTPICSGNRPEALFSWTAPADGTYRIDLTSELVLAPRLTVSDAVCGEGETAHCGEGPYVAEFAQGETVALGANQFGPFDGPVTLSISAHDCLATDLGSDLPASATGTIDPTRHDLIGNCGGVGGELVYTWTAPSEGEFHFSTSGSAGNTVLHVRDGASCGGPVLACSDHDEDTMSEAAALTLMLEAGQTVSVVLDTALPNDAIAVALTIEEVP